MTRIMRSYAVKGVTISLYNESALLHYADALSLVERRGMISDPE